MMQRSAAQVGAVIPGWRDIRQLGRINVIQVTARDLFPVGCVSLAGIKPVKPEHIDTAIVYAGLHSVGGRPHAARCLYEHAGRKPQPAGQGR